MNKNIALWLIAGLLAIWLLNTASQSGSRNAPNEISYSTFREFIEARKIDTVVIEGHLAYGPLIDGGRYITQIPAGNIPNLIPFLEKNHAHIKAVSEEKSFSIFGILISWFPMLLLIGVWIFFMRQMQGGKGGGGIMGGFGKSKARLLTQYDKRVTFEDVAGIDEAKQELEEIVEFLKNPQKFQLLGGQIPKGVLLVGPPGTGKTLLARAIAGEANVPFFATSGSAFVEMFVGVGASRVRDMFEQGKKNAPCIIFIDEVDALGRHRGAGLGHGNDEKEQTLNQLLAEMDGFESNEGVIIIAATNRPDVLDPALIRPGRFDRQVVVPNPDILGREKILNVHMKKVPIAPDVNSRVIARGTPGFSGADLANLVNEAALLAARKNKIKVTMAEFEAAKDKVLMGAERRSMVMTEEDKKLTAYHEAGHAIVTLYVPKADPLHKVTIIPRGRALGVTMSLPERDQLSFTKTQLISRLAILFGGRIAEELIFGEDNVSTGAGNDIQQATNMARRMVTEFGFSDKLGRIRYESSEAEVFLGHSVTQRKNISEETAALIDKEIHRFIEEAEKAARNILEEHRSELDTLSNALLEYETLSGGEVARILQGKEIRVNENGANESSAAKRPAGSVPSSGKPKKSTDSPETEDSMPENV